MNPDTPQTSKRAGKSPAGSGAAGEAATAEPSATVGASGKSAYETAGLGEPPGDRPAGTYESEAGRRTSGLLKQVKDKAASQLNQQKDRATAGIGGVADAVRETGRQLRDQHQDAVAQIVERAADQLERFSKHLRQHDIAALVGDAPQLARQQPALFIGSSFAAGLLAARFIKASSPARENRDEPPRGEEWGGERPHLADGDVASSGPGGGTSMPSGATEYPGVEQSGTRDPGSRGY